MRSCFRRSSRALLRARTGFTLLETLATLLILGLILAALLQFMTSVDRSWNSGATDPFAEAAEAFETIAQNLSVATLQPYQDYADSTGAFRTDPAAAFTPYQLARRSDLDFVCGPSATSSSPAWIQQLAGTTATTAILAENVVALVVLPERNSSDATLAPDYRYDSRDAGNPLTPEQLPPCLRVVLAAIDEASALRLAAAAGTAPPALIPPGSFQDAARIDPDIAGLDAALTTAKIGHRIFQRDIQVATASWSNAAAPALPAAP
jgi:prepilin-type N-terminal cleavage/methylation domain-containing protein